MRSALHSESFARWNPDLMLLSSKRIDDGRKRSFRVHQRAAAPQPSRLMPAVLLLRLLLGVHCELLAKSQLDESLLVAATEEGETAAKKCRREIEERLHRRETLRNFPAQGQTDSLPDTAVP
jgi:hypothetical protein